MTNNVYTVGQVNSYIKKMFASDFMMNRIYVSGEVSNCKYHTSGHIYFTLKDETGVISAVMFAGNRKNGLTFQMKNGDEVIVKGSIRVYEKGGSYQIYAEQITATGAGDLYRKYEEIKKELEEMGMFAPEYKQPIPEYCDRIGVVTAPTGAVIHDIQTVAYRRNPFVQIILYPAIVQGEYAVPSIVKGIETLQKMDVDVIIVGRGGGSIEDLWAFNEVEVARAIFDCPVPVISAVGHETDFTIADFVADMRAATPSAAAELAVYEYKRVADRAAEMGLKLNRSMSAVLERYHYLIERYELKLKNVNPEWKLKENRQAVDEYQAALADIMDRRLTAAKHRLEMLASALDGLSPLKKLNSGFSYVSDSEGNNVKSVKSVSVGDDMSIYMSDGVLKAKVLDKTEM